MLTLHCHLTNLMVQMLMLWEGKSGTLQNVLRLLLKAKIKRSMV